MRIFASISPWLPLFKENLPSFIVLEEKAAELYHLSLLEKPAASHRAKEVVLGVFKDGKSVQHLHDHLIRNGFRRRFRETAGVSGVPCSYFREDIGSVRFICPQIRPGQKPNAKGLAAMPDRRAAFLMESPHAVEVPYLGQGYEVFIPQVGRFILDKVLGLKVGRSLDPGKVYESSQDLLMVLDLLVCHLELQEETLDDFLEIRPPALLKEFFYILKNNGPGSVLWDSAQGLYLERYPGSKIVSLTKWYWEFLRDVSRLLEQLKKSPD